jgi:predicted O-methyltransferase YrrM
VPAAPRPSPRHAARDALNDLDFALRLRVLPRRVALTQLRARVVAELGTGTAWTTIALALAQTDREIDSYDPVVQVHRGRYLAQVPHDVRARIHLIEDVGASGPRSDAPVDMLYVDSFHDRENTLAEVTAWTPVMAPGSIMVFDDYTHTVHTGVAQAIDELGLAGEPQGSLFIHRPSAAPRLS